MEGARRTVSESGVECRASPSHSNGYKVPHTLSAFSSHFRARLTGTQLLNSRSRTHAYTRHQQDLESLLSSPTMALVFKIKHEETLRRWVVSESVNAEVFPVTLEQLQAKVRELFHFPASAVLAITYIDEENDVVTLAGDHDLVDACFIQRLNPLRLQVQVLEWNPNATPNDASRSADNFNVEGFLKGLFPHMTPEALQGHLQRYAQFLDPSLIFQAQDAFKEFLSHAARPEFHKPAHPFGKPAHHHPHKHPFHDHMHCKSMPNRGEHASPKDTSSSPALHLGVQCDGCGASPIQGSRYKSNKIPDFDLCSSCYQEKGKEGDFEKMEHPVHCPPFLNRHYRPPPCLGQGLKQFMGPRQMYGGRGGFARGPYGWRPERPERAFGHNEHNKLDARFVKDVTIFDGTELAPGTKFTKIWRMCNNGSLPWPQSTRLVHIGGDILSMQEAVHLELPEIGLAVGEEVDVSVDLAAPEKAGRYTSHWRLTSPAGQKFGQRVWVTVQVVPQGEQSPMLQESLKEGEGKGEKYNLTRDVPQGELSPMLQESLKEEGEGKGENYNMTRDGSPAVEVVEVPIVSLGEAERELPTVITEKMAERDGTPAVEIVEVPIVSLEEAERELPTVNTEKTAEMLVEEVEAGPSSHDVADVNVTEDVPVIIQELDGFSLVEKPGDKEMMELERNDQLELKLESLESMGFMDRDLNAVLLSKNDGNVQLTLDDLLVAAGWDGALEDLQEMGFTDQATNVRLLTKHKGSVKGAVRDLVQKGKQKA